MKETFVPEDCLLSYTQDQTAYILASDRTEQSTFYWQPKHDQVIDCTETE